MLSKLDGAASKFDGINAHMHFAQIFLRKSAKVHRAWRRRVFIPFYFVCCSSLIMTNVVGKANLSDKRLRFLFL